MHLLCVTTATKVRFETGGWLQRVALTSPDIRQCRTNRRSQLRNSVHL